MTDFSTPSDQAENQHMQAQLRQAYDELRIATNAAQAGWGYWDMQTGTAHWDERGRQIIGFADEAESLTAQGWLNRIHPEDLPQVEAHVADCLARDLPFDLEYRVIRADGQQRLIAAQGGFQKAADGTPLRGSGLVTDITDRQQADEARQKSEAEFRTVTEAAPALVWVCSASGENIYFNQRWYDYTGQTADDANGYGWTTTMHPEDAARILPYWQHCQQTGDPYEGEVRYRRYDGAYRWHTFRGLPRRNALGQIEAWYGLSIDTHGEKQAQEAIEQANQRKDEFLAMLAHELRNPLAPVRNGLQLLAQTQSQDPTLGTLLPIMNRQMDHIMRMMDDLLDVSRISRGKIELHKKRIDLVSVVAQAVDAMRPIYMSSDRNLWAQLPDYPLYLDGDPTRLHQVVTNLLTNGARYTHEGGQVWLSLEGLGQQAILRVKDNGIGLAADQLEAIFGLFVQVDQSLARSHGGLGLGLALVQQMVQLHGGQVEAHSPGLEEGSEFIVSLPTLMAESPATDHG